MLRPTFVHHPEHGDIFFSSILNRHGSWLDEHSYFGTIPVDKRPYHCTWADGSELSEDELAELRAVRACDVRCGRNPIATFATSGYTLAISVASFLYTLSSSYTRRAGS